MIFIKKLQKNVETRFITWNFELDSCLKVKIKK